MGLSRERASAPDPDTLVQSLSRGVLRGLAHVAPRQHRTPEAHWAPWRKILDAPALQYDPANPGGRLLVGRLGGQLIGIDDPRHALILGGTRAGKSVTVTANLYFWRGSALVIDPKGELASRTAAIRAAMGQKVYILDPFQRVEGRAVRFRAAYNPLSVLLADSPTLVQDAERITDGLVQTTGQEKDPHWDESAGAFITTLILLVATAPAYTGPERSLITVRRLLTRAKLAAPRDPERFGLLEELLDHADGLRAGGNEDLAEAIEAGARDFYDKSPNEMDSVLSTARRHTRLLGAPALREVLSGHDVDLSTLKAAPEGVTIYMCLPAGAMVPFSRWLRVLLNQVLDMAETVPARPGAPPMLVCLDEFPVLGRMKQLEHAIGQVAGFRLKLWVILQDWNQGVDLYGKRWESFAANAGLWQAFGLVDTTTCEVLSKKLGRTPVIVGRSSDVDSKGVEGGRTGLSHGPELHPLMSADEIERAFSRDDPARRQMVLWGGHRPMILQRVEYFDEASSVRPHFATREGR
ncbi:type IV secretory system conjugative DNA transfer family protein [Roseospira visakhapatnamensis]|uniref:Type IV secretion system protein VirD4 n=1 Tax=Roseospira visakhapatnamensis TaxID=390880 RepID=A0A7W6RGI3_9PROT|nr:type IV secretory system conjugative DNA transfer family protein [Roseospira visakhapatnamensis]MBB4267915.1 type IV secretion system protein VirD4 [Roseospira visakhapatnamensis]